MSNTFINQNGEEQSKRLGAADRLAIREEIRAIQKGQGTSAWYNPAKTYDIGDNGQKVLPETVYLGESNGAPTWNEPAFNMGKFREARTAQLKAMKEGSISSFDWGKYEDPFIGEWSGVNQEYNYLKKSGKIKS